MIFLTDIPTPCCTDVAGFQTYLTYLLAHRDTFLEFHGATRWRRLRWKSYIERTKAYNTLCQRITANDPTTVVAFGDGRFSSSSRGHASGPVQGLYRELKKRLRGRVRLVDEYRTSVMCSGCDERMDGRSRFWGLKVCKNICLVSISFSSASFCLYYDYLNLYLCYRHFGIATLMPAATSA
jgi:hypothetical protein